MGKIIIKLLTGNDNGTRDNLLDAAGSYFPKEDLKKLAKQCWKLAEEHADTFDRHSWFHWVEKLALQQDKHDLLLQAIYTELGDSEKVSVIVWKRFRQYRSVDRLDELLTVIGSEKRETVIAEGVADILAGDTSFNGSDTEFLLKTGHIDDAEKYLLQSAEQFNGDFYYTLLPLAKTMDKAERHLAASPLYRALLDSLESSINNWQRFPSHEVYREGISLAHGRKYSFWVKCEK